MTIIPPCRYHDRTRCLVDSCSLSNATPIVVYLSHLVVTAISRRRNNDRGRLSSLMRLVKSLLMLNPLPSAVILDLMERSSDSMKETDDLLDTPVKPPVYDVNTYVLMIARMKVPQGNLQLRSRLTT